VVEIGRCSGNLQRLSIWDLLRRHDLVDYLDNILDRNLTRDFDVLTKHFSPGKMFSECGKRLSPEGRAVLKSVVKTVLDILKGTGLFHGHLQAWDMTSRHRIDGRRLDSPFSAILTDDPACATFAVITSRCMTSNSFKRLSSSKDCKTRSLVLSTSICVKGLPEGTWLGHQRPLGDAEKVDFIEP
jgi:hypothetical protein